MKANSQSSKGNQEKKLFLFLEIFHEDLPFSEAKYVQTSILKTSEDILQKYNLKYDAITFNFSAKRFCFEFFGVEKQIICQEIKVIGPKITAVTQAIDGFCRKYNTTLESLMVESEYYVLVQPEKTLDTAAELPLIMRHILTKVASGFENTMNFDGDLWHRPIISTCCKLENNFITFLYAGIQSSDYIHSSNFPRVKIPFMEMENYAQNGININFQSRIEIIKSQILNIEKTHNIKCIANKNLIEDLGLISESPKLVFTKIPEQFMNLPREILVLTIEKNQKYILFERNGLIANIFGILSDDKSDEQSVSHGNLRVLCARLQDAKYYIDCDLKNFNTHNTDEALKSIVFHAKAGSIFDRIARIEAVADQFFPDEKDLKKAITICKNDLITDIVQSFTELQGYCGGVYLATLGEQISIADAVSEHYKPEGIYDAMPKTHLGQLLSFCEKYEKITTLIQYENPTSSRDPFGIRRDITGIIRLIRETNNIKLHHINGDDIFTGKLLAFYRERSQ